MNKKILIKSTIYGILGATILLTIYFSVVSLISGWLFAKNQFLRFWYLFLSLTIGFGIQVSLYIYLKTIIHQRNASSGVLAVSGTTSTVAMISCCAHYFVNILPILGTIGIINLISQYQIKLFWLGLILNILGIVYLSKKIYKIKRLK
jgi:Cu+-exporting ATPase